MTRQERIDKLRRECLPDPPPDEEQREARIYQIK